MDLIFHCRAAKGHGRYGAGEVSSAFTERCKRSSLDFAPSLLYGGADFRKFAVAVFMQSLQIAAVLLLDLGALVGLEERHHLRFIENLRFSHLRCVDAVDLGKGGLLLRRHGAFFDAGFGILPAQPFHCELDRALGFFVR
jgi:hypothetical protein